MKRAYVDSSVLIAVLLEEPGAGALARKVATLDLVAASNLVEAEVRSAVAREGKLVPPQVFSEIKWIVQDRPFSAEFERILVAGYLRGADLIHVASALYFFQDPSNGMFLTLDSTQREAAARLGFATDWSFVP